MELASCLQDTQWVHVLRHPIIIRSIASTQWVRFQCTSLFAQFCVHCSTTPEHSFHGFFNAPSRLDMVEIISCIMGKSCHFSPSNAVNRFHHRTQKTQPYSTKELPMCPRSRENEFLSKSAANPHPDHTQVLSRLRFGHVPSDEEKASIILTIQDQEAQIRALEDERDGLTSILRQIEEKRAEVELEVKYQSSLLAPIRQLPDELLFATFRKSFPLHQIYRNRVASPLLGHLQPSPFSCFSALAGHLLFSLRTPSHRERAHQITFARALWIIQRHILPFHI
jgi:hypothetical protein